jgi:hypothetical protein
MKIGISTIRGLSILLSPLLLFIKGELVMNKYIEDMNLKELMKFMCNIVSKEMGYSHTSERVMDKFCELMR